MSVMQVRRVGMLVLQRFVHVRMAVLARHLGRMGMTVVPVRVAVPVLVLHPLVPVRVGVLFPHCQNRAQDHQQKRKAVLKRDRLAEQRGG